MLSIGKQQQGQESARNQQQKGTMWTYAVTIVDGREVANLSFPFQLSDGELDSIGELFARRMRVYIKDLQTNEVHLYKWKGGE